jgi:hypothetical protein
MRSKKRRTRRTKQKQRQRRRTRRTRRRRYKGGEKNITRKSSNNPSLLPALINLGLVIPQKAINTALVVYLKFSNMFWKRVDVMLKQIPNQDTQDAATKNENLMKTAERVIADPQFQKEWKKTIKIISNVLLIPILLEIVQIAEKQGFIVADSVGKIARNIVLTGGTAAVDALLTVVGVVPGLGTAVDAAMLAQLFFHSITKLTMESMTIVTSLLSSVLAIMGKFLKPFRLAQEKISNLSNVVRKIKNKTAGVTNKATDAVAGFGQRTND